jgi:hypothetical protein
LIFIILKIIDTLIFPTTYYVRAFYGANNNSLAFIDISTQTYLEYLNVSGSDSLHLLDISNSSYLTTCYASSIDNLSELDLRNGTIVNLNNHDFDNNPLLTCISVDNLTLANALNSN